MARIIINLDLTWIDDRYSALKICHDEYRKYTLVAALHLGNCIMLSPKLERDYYRLPLAIRHRLEDLAEELIFDVNLNLWRTMATILPSSVKLADVRTAGLMKVEIYCD